MAFEDDDTTGAIDTSDSPQPAAGGDNSGAAPVAAAPDDNSGAAPVAAAPGGQEAIPTQDAGLGTDSTGQPATGPNGPIGRGVKKIVSYLMGAGAAHPAQLEQAAAQADPQGSMSPGDRNIMAVHDAGEMDGPAAAWALVQANRVAYNAKQAFAYAALNGNQKKPADLNAAIQAANQAGDHVLDGTSVQFSPGQNGVTATVMSPGSEQPQTFNLSTDQFREYLNVGRTGQWDRLMQDGIPATLQKIAAGGQRGQQMAGGRMQPPQPAGATPQPKQTNFGNTPSTMNLSGNQDAIPDSATADNTGYDPQLVARADRMFPGITQQGQRDQWLAAQEQRQDELQNKVDVAKETGENRVRAARETGNARVQAGDRAAQSRENVQKDKSAAWRYASDAKTATAQITADQKAAHAGNLEAQQRVESARKAIAAKRATGATLSPEDEAFEKQLVQRAGSQPAQPQRPAAQQQAPQGQPPVPGAKFYKGSWYTRGPNGESVPVNQ